MTWKTALLDACIRGRQGRHRGRPTGMTSSELQPHDRRFTRHQPRDRHLPQHPAPDINTNAQTMAWMMDAYSARRYSRRS
jgi:glutamate dehydrogenase (NAD(P)+)